MIYSAGPCTLIAASILAMVVLIVMVVVAMPVFSMFVAAVIASSMRAVPVSVVARAASSVTVAVPAIAIISSRLTTACTIVGRLVGHCYDGKSSPQVGCVGQLCIERLNPFDGAQANPHFRFANAIGRDLSRENFRVRNWSLEAKRRLYHRAIGSIGYLHHQRVGKLVPYGPPLATA